MKVHFIIAGKKLQLKNFIIEKWLKKPLSLNGKSFIADKVMNTVREIYYTLLIFIGCI